ncbi:hypothetical protein P8C59_000505 [Phyllachora maydis]|uniref:Major facilitator superfamily (MFS) profile domain-containing protein n=1 Tax=Phyllachora maydis TaxID=1825666 RepID=A0AAD9HXC8_9PEZI|nr:hypothetical protein P8C59_000505 [Phyllachora maydis]
MYLPPGLSRHIARLIDQAAVSYAALNSQSRESAQHATSMPPQQRSRSGNSGHLVSPVTAGDVLLIEERDGTQATVTHLSPVPSDDPDDPLNWSTWRKTLNYALVCAVTIMCFHGLYVQSVFWQQMSVDLGLSFQQLNRTQSAMLAGLAFGCIFFIPFAKKYGRRPAYVISVAVLAAVTWWATRVQSLWELYVTNLLFGLAGAMNETLVQMTIADLFFVHQRGRINALYMLSVVAGAFLTPMAAGTQAASVGWRWAYYTFAIIITVMFLVFLFAYEETKRPALLDGVVSRTTEAADAARPSTDDEKKAGAAAKVHRTATTTTSGAAALPRRRRTHRLRLPWTTPTGESLWKVAYFPVFVAVLPHVLFTGVQFAAGIVWTTVLVASISIIFSAPPYNFDTAGVGYMSLGPFLGNVVGAVYAAVLSDWSVKRLARRNGGYFEPEFRLYLLLLPSLLMGGGLVMFGVTADRGMHWIFPSIGGACFTFGACAMGDAAFTLVIDAYRPLTAEAFVGITFLRNAISIPIPFAIAPWRDAMGLTNMFTVAGVLCFAIAMLFVPLIIYGKRIRLAMAPRAARLLEQQGAIMISSTGPMVSLRIEKLCFELEMNAERES